jgi:hypothetical protein
MCRSVGSPVSAKSDGVLLGGVAHRAHERRQRALHVVGAAADEAVALDARRELPRAGGDDVHVAVEDDRRPVEGADVGQHDRQAVVLAVVDVDVASLEPALDERSGRPQALGPGGVVGDQPLGEDLFVHSPEHRAHGRAERGAADGS